MLFFVVPYPAVCGKEGIDLRTEKQKADHHEHPEHEEHDGTQGSVHVGDVPEIGKINGKKIGEYQPAPCCKESSRIVPAHRGGPPGHDPVDQHKAGKEEGKGNEGAESQDVGGGTPQ